jgi:hypothetical protein
MNNETLSETFDIKFLFESDVTLIDLRKCLACIETVLTTVEKLYTKIKILNKVMGSIVHSEIKANIFGKSWETLNHCLAALLTITCIIGPKTTSVVDTKLQDHIFSIRDNIGHINQEIQKPVVDQIIAVPKLFQCMQNILITVYDIKFILKQSIRELES